MKTFINIIELILSFIFNILTLTSYYCFVYLDYITLLFIRNSLNNDINIIDIFKLINKVEWKVDKYKLYTDNNLNEISSIIKLNNIYYKTSVIGYLFVMLYKKYKIRKLL